MIRTCFEIGYGVSLCIFPFLRENGVGEVPSSVVWVREHEGAPKVAHGVRSPGPLGRVQGRGGWARRGGGRRSHARGSPLGRGPRARARGGGGKTSLASRRAPGLSQSSAAGRHGHRHPRRGSRPGYTHAGRAPAGPKRRWSRDRRRARRCARRLLDGAAGRASRPLTPAGGESGPGVRRSRGVQ